MVGIYKTHDITKTLTINPTLVMEEIEKKRKEKIILANNEILNKENLNKENI